MMMMMAMSRVWTSTARQSSRQTQQIAVCAARSMRSLLRKYTGDHIMMVKMEVIKKDCMVFYQGVKIFRLCCAASKTKCPRLI